MVAAFDYCLHGRGGAAPSIDTAMHGLVDADARRPPPSGLGDRPRDGGRRRGPDPSLLRRPRGLGRLAPARVPARARHRRDPARPARGDRGDPRRARDHGLGRDVRGVRGALARDHPDRRAVHRRARPAGAVRRRRSRASSRCPRPSATPGPPRSCRSSAASPRPIARWSATTPTATSSSTSSPGPSIRDWRRSARRAPTTSCGRRSGRWSSTCRRPPTSPTSFARLRELHEAYRDDYRAYYERHATPDSPPMRGADPAIVLVPGHRDVLASGRTSRPPASPASSTSTRST